MKIRCLVLGKNQFFFGSKGTGWYLSIVFFFGRKYKSTRGKDATITENIFRAQKTLFKHFFLLFSFKKFFKSFIFFVSLSTILHFYSFSISLFHKKEEEKKCLKKFWCQGFSLRKFYNLIKYSFYPDEDINVEVFRWKMIFVLLKFLYSKIVKSNGFKVAFLWSCSTVFMAIILRYDVTSIFFLQ